MLLLYYVLEMYNRIIPFLKRVCRIIFIGTVDHKRNGDSCFPGHCRIHSSRIRYSFSETCRLRGGLDCRGGVGAAHRKCRCASEHRLFCHQVLVWFVLALCHHSYLCDTIITHMRINHLNYCNLTLKKIDSINGLFVSVFTQLR